MCINVLFYTRVIVKCDFTLQDLFYLYMYLIIFSAEMY